MQVILPWLLSTKCEIRLCLDVKSTEFWGIFTACVFEGLGDMYFGVF